MEPIIEIHKNKDGYPQSLMILKELAPDVICVQGDASLLNDSLAAFISTTEVTESNAIKVGKMSEEIKHQYHWIFSMDSTVADFSLIRCRDAASKPVILVKESLDDYTDTYGEHAASMLEEIVDDGGLIISFGYEDKVKCTNPQAQYDVMAALADIVAVPLCTKKDYAVRRAMDYAKELGKDVLVNKEELINLKK